MPSGSKLNKLYGIKSSSRGRTKFTGKKRRNISQSDNEELQQVSHYKFEDYDGRDPTPIKPVKCRVINRSKVTSLTSENNTQSLSNTITIDDDDDVEEDESGYESTNNKKQRTEHEHELADLQHEIEGLKEQLKENEDYYERYSEVKTLNYELDLKNKELQTFKDVITLELHDTKKDHEKQVIKFQKVLNQVKHSYIQYILTDPIEYEYRTFVDLTIRDDIAKSFFERDVKLNSLTSRETHICEIPWYSPFELSPQRLKYMIVVNCRVTPMGKIPFGNTNDGINTFTNLYVNYCVGDILHNNVKEYVNQISVFLYVYQSLIELIQQNCNNDNFHNEVDSIIGEHMNGIDFESKLKDPIYEMLLMHCIFYIESIFKTYYNKNRQIDYCAHIIRILRDRYPIIIQYKTRYKLHGDDEFMILKALCGLKKSSILENPEILTLAMAKIHGKFRDLIKPEDYHMKVLGMDDIERNEYITLGSITCEPQYIIKLYDQLKLSVSDDYELQILDKAKDALLFNITCKMLLTKLEDLVDSTSPLVRS